MDAASVWQVRIILSLLLCFLLTFLEKSKSNLSTCFTCDFTNQFSFLYCKGSREIISSFCQLPIFSKVRYYNFSWFLINFYDIFLSIVNSSSRVRYYLALAQFLRKVPFLLFWQFTFNLKRTWPNTNSPNSQYFPVQFQGHIIFIQSEPIYRWGPINFIQIFPKILDICVR